MAEGEFMNNPLVLWIETFKPQDAKALEYKDLYDGVFLNDVMQQIDQREAYGNVQRTVEDVSVRIINWDILVKNIRAYYMEVLQQLLIWRLPNIQLICRDPEKEQSLGEVRRTLLLILGCAVQCEHKQVVVDNIKRLDLAVQQAIVDHIKEITDDNEAVLPIDPPPDLEAYSEKMFGHITRLIKDRDTQQDVIHELTHERDYYMAQAQGAQVPPPPPAPVSPEKHHLAMELAEIKTRLRHTRQELEDKLELVTDLRDELDATKSELAKVKMENADLTQEARTTRSLRDELDIVKEKANKVDLCEKEIIRYKERLNELEFYKARTEELREETLILEETRTMLEEQLATSRRRVETVVELEAELNKYREQIEQLSAERDWDRERIELLTEDNARLEFEKKTSMNESASLEQELEESRAKIGNMKGSLSEQLTETSNAKILRLELENQRLTSKLREMQEGALIASAEVNLQKEKENQRLVKRIEKLQESVQEASQKLLATEEEREKVAGECRELQQALELVKEDAERQVRELEQENMQLTSTVEILRERNEKTNDARMKELERDNKRLTETLNAKNAQLSKMEFEHRQTQRSMAKLSENAEQLKLLEKENAGLEKENAELHHQVTAMQHSALQLEKAEQELSDLDVENRKLQKTVESLQNTAKRKEELERENINLTVEKQKLERSLENLKVSSSKVADLESEKDLLNKEIHQVRKLLESQKAQKIKQEQLEFAVIDLENEKGSLDKALEVTTRRLQQLEKDNADMEAENEQLLKQIQASKVTSKRLEDHEKESRELQGELDKVQKDKAVLEKENRKLRQVLDMKEASVEEAAARQASLVQEVKTLQKGLEQKKVLEAKNKELEKENKEMFTERNSDRKTMATLREELVKEKIRSQELHNELEKLHAELEHIGINRKKLLAAEQSQDDNRLRALESMMQETLNKNSEIKDEKIQALETRLEESKNRNLKVQEELRQARREIEAMKQRMEEEAASEKDGRARDRMRVTEVRHVQSSPSNPTRDILDLKDHLVSVERTNATLLADNSNLQSNVASLSEQCGKLERQIHMLQSHGAQLQGQTTSLQSHNAQLQVENTTLQSRATSLTGEKADLQTQLSNLETEHDVLIQRHDELTSRHLTLVRDHEKLQDLHKQLSLEYEALVSEHGSLKSIHKSLKQELKDSQERLDAFLQGRNDENKVREMLDKERQQLRLEQRTHGNLKEDYGRLRDDHNRMQAAYDRLSKDYTDSLASHKALKSEVNVMQLRLTEQQEELTEYREQLLQAVTEVQKAENKLETMYTMNEQLQTENQALLEQLRQLLNQNSDLLSKVLNSKDHFAEEEKQYLEKLAEMRRQKERLEEKIMEHYKNRLNSPKKGKGLGAMIARKARNIISRAPRRSKSRPDLSTLNDNSQGPGSHSDGLEMAGGSRSGAAAPVGHLITLQISGYHAAKSTDNLSKEPAADDDLDGGFQTLSPKLVPRGATRGRMSPGSEMLTLQQFLRETTRDAGEVEQAHKDLQRLSGRRRSLDDTESRSSENSDQSGQRNAILRLQTAAAAHHQQQMLQQQQQLQQSPDLNMISSPLPEGIPHERNSSRYSSSSSGGGGCSVTAQDPNVSRMSRISSSASSHGTAGSDSSSPAKATSARMEVMTSTPNKPDLPPSGYSPIKVDISPAYKGGGGRERGPGGRRGEGWHQDEQPKYAVPHQHNRNDNRYTADSEPTYTAASPPQSSAVKLSGPEPLRSPPPPPQSVVRPMSGRELPPTPAERRESNHFSPIERVDQRMRVAVSGDKEELSPDPHRHRSGYTTQQKPIPRSRSVGPRAYPHPDEAGEGDGEREQSPSDRAARRDERPYRDQNNRRDSEHFKVAGGRQLPQSTSALHGPRAFQRPASAMGRPTSVSTPLAAHSHQQSSANSVTPMQRQSSAREVREANMVRAEPVINNAWNGPALMRSDRSDSQHQGYLERPKSVPPHLFHKVDISSGGQDAGSNSNSYEYPGAPPPHKGETVVRPALDREHRSSGIRDASLRLSLDGSAGNQLPPGGVTPHGQSSAQNATPLPNRFSGPGGPPSPGYSPGGPGVAAVNHTSGSGRHPSAHGYGSPSGYHTPQAPAGLETAGIQLNHGRGSAPGLRHSSEPYSHETSADSYAPASRPPGSAGARPAHFHHGNQQRPPSGANTPGPQHTYRRQPSEAGGVSSRGDYNQLSSPDTPGSNRPTSSTPTARIPPQTKATTTSTPPMAGRSADPALAAQRTAVGDEQSPPDRPKQNSVWMARRY